MTVSLRLLELFRHASNWKGWLCWLALHEPQTTALVASIHLSWSFSSDKSENSRASVASRSLG